MDAQRGTSLQVSWILRIGIAMEFIGHGALGLLRTAAWTPYFAALGVPRETALSLMPFIGAIDVALGLAVLLYPMRAALLYMALWGLATAVMRPLAGESAWEAVERAGNIGAAAALFLMATGSGMGSWFCAAGFDTPKGGPSGLASWVLRLTTAGLLLGHGALGLLEHKAMLSSQYAAVGLQGSWAEPMIGGFECALALAVLARPAFGLLVFVFAWKLATEALSPMAGSSIWVFVEHGGSYAAPLALALLSRRTGEAVSAPLGGSPA
jgi:hypothetical protein